MNIYDRIQIGQMFMYFVYACAYSNIIIHTNTLVIAGDYSFILIVEFQRSMAAEIGTELLTKPEQV